MNKKKLQKGGGNERVIPPYKTTSTYKSTDTQVPKKKIQSSQTRNKFSNNQTVNPFTNNKPQHDDLISFKISKDIINQQMNDVPRYRQVHPAPFVPTKYPAPNTPYVTGNTGRLGDNPYFYTTNNVPVINNYKIDAGGVNADHINLNNIYEDILPESLRYSKLTSINDRTSLYSYLRSTFITYEDGEYINISTIQKGGTNTFDLLGRVKLMEFNPFNFNKFTSNPYKNLTGDMVLFRSCYPMSFNSISMKCGRNNINLNIRIYDMNVSDFCANRIGGSYTWDRRDVWREIGFYEYLREKIIKSKICPHFPILFGYYISDNKKINFEKFRILNIKNKNRTEIKQELKKKAAEDLLIKKALQKELKKLRDTKESSTNIPTDKDKYGNIFYIGSYVFNKDPDNSINNIVGYIVDIMEDTTTNSTKYMLKKINAAILDDIEIVAKKDMESYYTVIKNIDSYNQLVPDKELNRNINFDPARVNDLELLRIMRFIQPSYPSGKCLISITESYNYPFRLWASRIYEKEMNISNKMIHTGYHSVNVWYSILFQLLYTLATMFNYNFNIHNFDIDNNVYIKFLGKEESSFGYWKYIINNVEYYIPNYGYMVIFDSNYKNISSTTSSLPLNSAQNIQQTYKCTSTKIFTTPSGNNTYYNIRRNFYNSLLKLFTYDSLYGADHLKYGGIAPDDEIIKLYKDIEKELTKYTYNYSESHKEQNIFNINFEKIFYTFFYRFLHNRIGTIATKDDLNYVNMEYIETNPINGNIYVNDDNRFVLYIKSNNTKYEYVEENNETKNTIITENEGIVLNITRKTIDKELDILDEKKSNMISLRKYESDRPLAQNYKLVDSKFTINNLIETYHLNIDYTL